MQSLAAGNLPDDAGVNQHFVAFAVTQSQRVEIGDLVGMPGQKIGLRSARGCVGGQDTKKRFERVRQIGFPVTEQRFEAGRKPAQLIGKFEVEHTDAAVIRDLGQTFFGAETGFLEFLAVGDIEVGTDDTLQRTIGAIELQADALHPHIVALGVLHAKLERELPRTGGAAALPMLGGGGRIVGMDQRQPSVIGIWQGGVGVAQHAFPSRRIINFVFQEVQIEKSERTALIELDQEIIAGGGRGGEWRGGRHRRRGRNRRGEQTDKGEVADGVVPGFFNMYGYVERGGLLGLEFQGDGLALGDGEQDFPLRLNPPGFP